MQTCHGFQLNKEVAVIGCSRRRKNAGNTKRVFPMGDEGFLGEAVGERQLCSLLITEFAGNGGSNHYLVVV